MAKNVLSDGKRSYDGGAFRDNNMHKQQCIGPGHWAGSRWLPVCFLWQRLTNRTVAAEQVPMEEVCKEG